MNWIAYADINTPTKVGPDTLGPCSICCSVVRADEMWGTRDDEGEKSSWVVCDGCHARYLDDPEGGQNAAQFRWDANGPCKEMVNA